MKSLPINGPKIASTLTGLMDGHVKYAVGSGHGKVAHASSVPPEKVTELDCSGFVAYVLYHASNGGLVLHGRNSAGLADWCKEQGFAKEKGYAPLAAVQDNVLRLAYMPPPPKHKYGHVWLVHNGATLESHGGAGPDSRPWNEAILAKHATHLYKLGNLNMTRKKVAKRNTFATF